MRQIRTSFIMQLCCSPTLSRQNRKVNNKIIVVTLNNFSTLRFSLLTLYHDRHSSENRVICKNYLKEL